MSRTEKHEERKPKSVRPKIIMSTKRPNLIANLRVQPDADYYVEETYYPTRYHQFQD